ncbi:NnrU family protein [Oleiphilus messinensis]|uniref:NnrU family protein n=1 Tax=Oleiphilus messinensis TaxID=141451 RepID=A0A1Y0I4U6_9GAMM|nr:NnrU family protein [Oleiphilus messinensis]ARU55507.1 NnrU family protein [Oleiphilus messinensis]
MIVLILGLILFLGVHSISIFNVSWRNQMVTRYGEQRFKGIYSLVALAGFVLIVWGYGLARMEPVVVYNPPFWLRHVAMLLLIPVFPLLVAAHLPSRIGNIVKHPMLVAVKLWALAHLLANGMLADLLLFGAFLGWAVADRISVKKRPVTPGTPPPTGVRNDIIVIVAGLALFIVFSLWLHAWLIGVAPIAR